MIRTRGESRSDDECYIPLKLVLYVYLLKVLENVSASLCFFDSSTHPPSLPPGLISVSYDEWDYGIEARVRDAVAVIATATTTMMLDRGPHTLLKSGCHGAPDKKGASAATSNEVLK